MKLDSLYDDKGFPIKGEPEWVSPSMISVSDKLPDTRFIISIRN
jgi:hypothetical protein